MEIQDQPTEEAPDEETADSTVSADEISEVRQLLEAGDRFESRRVETAEEAEDIIEALGHLTIYYEGERGGEVFATSLEAEPEQIVVPEAEESAGSSTDDSVDIQDADMTREELRAYLESNEERVRRMTEGISAKMDNLDSRIDRFGESIEQHLENVEASNAAFKAEVRQDLVHVEESNKWIYRLSAAILSLLVLFIGAWGLISGSGSSRGGGIPSFELKGLEVGRVLRIAGMVVAGFAVLFVLGAVIVGGVARSKGEGFWEWFLLSLPNPIQGVRQLRQEERSPESEDVDNES